MAARDLIWYILLCGLQCSLAHQKNALCSGKTVFDQSCSTQLLDGSVNTCTIKYYPTNSDECDVMKFGDFVENEKLGQVKLEPYIFTYLDDKYQYQVNYTVLNVTFTNIKWKSMQFRFKRQGSALKNHCRNIVIAPNVTVHEQSVLYYDCWWSDQESIYEGDNYTLDFRAEGDLGVKRGQYYFTIPSVQQLDPTVKLQDWKPFMYMEVGLQSDIVLHVTPAPASLRIRDYGVAFAKECPQCPGGSTKVDLKCKIGEEVICRHPLLGLAGNYYFVVTPVHEDYPRDPTKVCQSVSSPIIKISSDSPGTVVCIASIMSVVVALLFAYYLVLRLARRYWCRDSRYWDPLAVGEDGTKTLVLYSAADKLHAECVTSFVNHLRFDCGLHVMYLPDVTHTELRDPYVWLKQAFAAADNIVYIVGPAEASHSPLVTADHGIDKLQMTFLKECRANKQVVNVLFQHSRAPIPVETLNDKTFHLLKDWNKLMSFLARHQRPGDQLRRTQHGRQFFESLKLADKYFGHKSSADVDV